MRRRRPVPQCFITSTRGRLRAAGLIGLAAAAVTAPLLTGQVAEAAPRRPVVRTTVLDSGTVWASAQDIGGRGVVAGGRIAVEGLNPDPVRWVNGTAEVLPATPYSFGTAVDDRGRVLVQSAFEPVVALWDGPDKTDLSPGSGDLNNAGQIMLAVPTDVENRKYKIDFLDGGRRVTVDPDWISGNVAKLAPDGAVVYTDTGADGSAPVKAYRWRNGSRVQLKALRAAAPAEPGVQVQSVAGNGLSAGDSTVSNGIGHAALWRGGAVTDLGKLRGDATSQATGVNDGAVVVGTSATADYSSIRPFVWEQGRMREITVRGYGQLYPQEINNQGQVALRGTLIATGEQHALLWQDGAVADLGANSNVQKLNDNGVAVGQNRDLKAVVWRVSFS